MRFRALLCFAISYGLVPQGVAQTLNQIEIGAGFNTVDDYRFGRYTGLQDRGGFAVGNFSYTGRDAAAADDIWSLRGRNLGLETISIGGDYSRPGKFSVEFNYAQLPYYGVGDSRTIYDFGSSSLAKLPANWVGASSTAGFTALNSSLREFGIDKKRERFNTGFEWQFAQGWKMRSEYRHEAKQGNEALGAIFGSTGGNPRGALLARPIDFITDDISLSIDYAGAANQFAASYNILDFSNHKKTLYWENAFNNSQWLVGANFSNAAVGQLALEPDNRSSQWSVSAGHSFAGGARVSGSLTGASLEQDDRFLPFSNVLPSSVPLPRASLDGRVESLTANLNFSTRIGNRSSLRLRYNYRDRDNQTRQAIFQRVPGDAAAQSSLLGSGARVNRIYDLERSVYALEFDYRLTAKARLSSGIEREETTRSMVDVDTTEEDSGYLKLNLSPFASATGWIKVSHAERTNSNYNAEIPFITGHNPDYVATLLGNALYENDPLLRRYHLAERDREEISASMSFFPSDEWGLTTLVKLRNDDFPYSITGLQSSEVRNLALDFSYSPDADWSANAYYNFETYQNSQKGYQRSGGGNPTPFFPASVRIPGNNWSIDSEDRVHTVGVGLNWTLLDGRLKMGLDGNYSDAVTETEPYSSGLAWAAFADIGTEITSLSLRADYHFEAGRELRLRYFYQDFNSSDWALDETTVDSLANILLLGNGSPNYSGGLFEISVLFRFD
jgi:MtrB/PioB family decaheme-associated outer membrane protein